MTRWAMAVDLQSCVGCSACAVACKAEHGTPPGIFWMRVVEKEEGTYPHARRVFIPVRCNHCEQPPCETICPTGATYKRPDGIVAVDQGQCVGCQACMIACPYQVRFRWDGGESYYADGLTPYEQVSYGRFEPGTVQKCDFCADRLVQGRPPACVQTCPAGALHVGDLDDPSSPLLELLRRRSFYRPLEELGTQPKLFYLT
jgi:molybdopterin-containing oxidoreductase family iron-sulfur binding subunit